MFYLNKFENDVCLVYAEEERAKLYSELTPLKFLETVKLVPDGKEFFVIVRADNGYPLLCYKDEAVAKSIVNKFTVVKGMKVEDVAQKYAEQILERPQILDELVTSLEEEPENWPVESHNVPQSSAN